VLGAGFVCGKDALFSAVMKERRCMICSGDGSRGNSFQNIVSYTTSTTSDGGGRGDFFVVVTIFMQTAVIFTSIEQSPS
jgi:hypothetical protein